MKVRSIRRRPEDERWNRDESHSMRGVPWEVVPGHPDRELKSRVLLPRAVPVPGPEAEVREVPVRRMYIQRKDVEKYGATEGCEGCKAAVRGGESRNHTEECRKRIEKAMRDAKDIKWERTNSKLAKKIEEGGDNKKREVEGEVEGQAKRQRQGGPQQEVSTPKQEVSTPQQGASSSSWEGGAAAQGQEGRKRKAEEEVQQEERQANKAIAVEDDAPEDDAMEDEGMQEVSTMVLNTRGMLLNLRSKRWDFSRREDRNEVREIVDQDMPVMVIGPEVYSTLGKYRTKEETKTVPKCTRSS